MDNKHGTAIELKCNLTIGTSRFQFEYLSFAFYDRTRLHSPFHSILPLQFPRSPKPYSLPAQLLFKTPSLLWPPSQPINHLRHSLAALPFADIFRILCNWFLLPFILPWDNNQPLHLHSVLKLKSFPLSHLQATAWRSQRWSWRPC